MFEKEKRPCSRTEVHGTVWDRQKVLEKTNRENNTSEESKSFMSTTTTIIIVVIITTITVLSVHKSSLIHDPTLDSRKV